MIRKSTPSRLCNINRIRLLWNAGDFWKMTIDQSKTDVTQKGICNINLSRTCQIRWISGHFVNHIFHKIEMNYKISFFWSTIKLELSGYAHTVKPPDTISTHTNAKSLDKIHGLFLVICNSPTTIAWHQIHTNTTGSTGRAP